MVGDVAIARLRCKTHTPYPKRSIFRVSGYLSLEQLEKEYNKNNTIYGVYEIYLLRSKYSLINPTLFNKYYII